MSSWSSENAVFPGSRAPQCHEAFISMWVNFNHLSPPDFLTMVPPLLCPTTLKRGQKLVAVVFCLFLLKFGFLVQTGFMYFFVKVAVERL